LIDCYKLAVITNLDVVFPEFNAFSTAWLSTHIAIDALHCVCKELTHGKIADT